MATNEVFREGDTLVLPVIAGVVSGDAVSSGSFVGVALTDRDAAGNATVRLKGVFNVSVTGALATAGLPVYITVATGALVVASGAGIIRFGTALEAKGAGAGVIPVAIFGSGQV